MIDTKTFFHNSDLLDRLILRPLSHIKSNWELTWNNKKQKYENEKDSFAQLLNQLVKELGSVNPPARYHDNEDCLAEYVKSNFNWKIKKVTGRWEGEDYAAILENGGFHDSDEENLILAAAGRIKAAINRGQLHFDDMEQSHQKILAEVLAIILYHREQY